MFTECCESSTRADIRRERETVPDSRSSSAEGTGAKYKLDRATDNMLAEADRKALYGLCR